MRTWSMKLAPHPAVEPQFYPPHWKKPRREADGTPSSVRRGLWGRTGVGGDAQQPRSGLCGVRGPPTLTCWGGGMDAAAQVAGAGRALTCSCHPPRTSGALQCSARTSGTSARGAGW